MKQEIKEKRSTILPVIRVSPSEKEAIKKAYLASSYANQSTFIRSTLLEKTSLTVNEKRLQAELTAGKIYKETTKIEAQILEMVQELKIKEGGKLNKKHLLPYAKLLQSVKTIKAQLNEEELNMISNITSGNSFYDVAMYNQKKVNQQEASILYSQKLRGTKPETLQKAFQNYNLSISTKPVIHVSLSFAREDEGQLTDEKMVELSKEYLQKMGYGKQPYIIYRHFDTPHPHVHILSTRVDIETQKRINDSFDYIRSKQITEKMEQTYGLTKADQQTSIKSELVDHLQSAFQKERPENITQLNQSLEKLNLPVRARETQKGLIYHGVREDGVRHSKYYRSSIYKEVGLDAPSLQAQFQQNIQAKQYLKTAIQQALPKEGKTSIGLFSKELQSKGILTDFKVTPDDTINISYQYKDHVYKDAVIKTNAQEQLVFPKPQDYHLREQLTRSIAANEPLELGYENGKVTVATPNPTLEKELNKRSNGEILALSDIHKEYRSEYQQAGNSGIRNAVLALAATDIDDTLQEQINRERIDQREIKR